MKEVFWTTCSQPIWKCGCPDMPFLGTLKINFHNLNVVTIKLVIIFRVARQMKPGDCTTSFLSLSNCQRTLTDGRKCLNIWSWPLADLRNSNSNGKTNKRGPQMMNDSTKRCKRILYPAYHFSSCHKRYLAYDKRCFSNHEFGSASLFVSVLGRCRSFHIGFGLLILFSYGFWFGGCISRISCASWTWAWLDKR